MKSGDAIFFRGFGWKLLIIKEKPGQKNDESDKLLSSKQSLTTDPSQSTFAFPCASVNLGRQVL